MGERDNRPTTPTPVSRVAKAHPVAGWTALVAVIPAIVMAWQSGNTADSAKHNAHDVSERGYDRDTRFLRRTKRVNDHQDNEIDECFARLDDVSEALEELYAHVNDADAHKVSRRIGRPSRPMSEASTKSDWTRPPRYTKPNGGQVQMPLNLEDL